MSRMQVRALTLTGRLYTVLSDSLLKLDTRSYFNFNYDFVTYNVPVPETNAAVELRRMTSPISTDESVYFDAEDQPQNVPA
jgi:hypothetical protein